MRIDILTLFPAMFAPLNESIVKRAAEKGVVSIGVTNIRDFAADKHHLTDDRLYGGGAGMVMKPEPIYRAVRAVKSAVRPRVIFTSPQGRPFDQKLAGELAKEEQLIIVCGHYEGVDERVIELLATDVVSLGDFVLTGGELPAMCIADAVARLLPGALGDEMSSMEESFDGGLLEYPHYTRPPVFMEKKVPEVLLSGDHAKIRKWRRQKALARTWERRPELLQKAGLSGEDLAFLEGLRQGAQQPYEVYLALLHYPVYNKKREVVNTSLTNLDLHDIARAAATYDVKRFYLVQPLEGQRGLIGQLLHYWREGFGAAHNPHRSQALQRAALAASLAQVEEEIAAEAGKPPVLVATSARITPETTGYREMRKIMREQGGAYLLLFGTGWGMTEEVMQKASYTLRPVYGRGEYNHLSVRSAASIVLDRLLGEKFSP